MNVIYNQLTRLFDHAYRLIYGLPLERFSLITPNIYLGGQHSLKALEKMKDLGVEGVVNMRTSQPHRDTIEKMFRYLNLNTIDKTPPKIEDLKVGTQFMKEIIDNGGKVYVHCRMGEGRGPSMVIAYLMSQGDTFAQALSKVKNIRGFINLNKEQTKNLMNFEKIVST